MKKTLYFSLIILGIIAGFFTISEFSWMNYGYTVLFLFTYLMSTTAGVLGLLDACDKLPDSCYKKD